MQRHNLSALRLILLVMLPSLSLVCPSGLLAYPDDPPLLAEPSDLTKVLLPPTPDIESPWLVGSSLTVQQHLPTIQKSGSSSSAASLPLPVAENLIVSLEWPLTNTDLGAS